MMHKIFSSLCNNAFAQVISFSSGVGLGIGTRCWNVEMSDGNAKPRRRDIFRKLLPHSQRVIPTARASTQLGLQQASSSTSSQPQIPPSLEPQDPHRSRDSQPDLSPNPPLPPPRPRRDLWNEALQTLSPKENEFISKNSASTSSSISTTLEEILKNVQVKREACQQKQWTIKYREKTPPLHDMASKVCGLLEKFKQFGDIAVNVDPLHAGLPWACVRLLLQVCYLLYYVCPQC